MPTYDYECPKCGKREEIFHRMTEKPQLECQICKTPLKKLIGAGAGIIFKGSGFYCTDYRNDDYQQKARKEKGSPSATQTNSTQATSATTTDNGDNGKSASNKTAADSGAEAAACTNTDNGQGGE